MASRLPRPEEPAPYSKIPVILVTSKTAPSDRYWGEQQGANGYVAKPFTPDELHQRREEVCLMDLRSGQSRARPLNSKRRSSSKANRFAKSAGPSGNIVFFAPAASDFVFPCWKWRKWWIGRS